MKETEKLDPLIRIQEEIKEVVRREQEYKQLINGTPPTSLNDNENDNDNDNDNDNEIENDNNNNNNDNIINVSSVNVNSLVNNYNQNGDNDQNNSIGGINSQHHEIVLTINGVNNYGDEHHSDDSGISASSSPVNVNEIVNKVEETKLRNETIVVPNSDNSSGVVSSGGGSGGGVGKEHHRFIGSNNFYNLIPEPQQKQNLIIRTMPAKYSINKQRQIAFNGQKGVMERFIASRGKLQLNRNYGTTGMNEIMLNGKSAATLLGYATTTTTNTFTPPNTPVAQQQQQQQNIIPEFSISNSTTVIVPAVIERDADGRPIRPGYIPVELKIQRELKDLKTRESELKKIRKIRNSTPNLLDAIQNEENETDDDDSVVEHCYGPGKLRSAKSINELCDMPQNSISPRATPSPDFDGRFHRFYNENNKGMRPALSLAQLCDLSPEEAENYSSHRLITQWENIIQQNINK